MFSLRRFRQYQNYCCVLLAGSVLTVAAGSEALPDTAPIDSTIVLRIGPQEISRYALEQEFKHSGHSSGLAAAGIGAQDWFETFVVRQIATAEAIKEGYRDRAEVLENVQAMEKHMLTNADGLLYKKLAAAHPITPEKVRELYTLRANVLHVTGARLPQSYAPVFRAPEWKSATSEQRAQRLRALAKSDDAIVYYRGVLSWPFDPFPELGAQLADPQANAWLEEYKQESCTIAFIESLDVLPLAAFGKVQKPFTAFAEHQERIRLRRERCVNLLNEMGFAAQPDTIARASKVLHELPPGTLELPTEAFLPIAQARIATYRQHGREIAVTVDLWRTDYNHQLLRVLPRNSADLEQSVRDFVLSEIDLEEARRLALDCTPQFSEGRRHFLSAQILDRFEREQLLPKITVTDGEIQERMGVIAKSGEPTPPASAERAFAQTRTAIAHEKLLVFEKEHAKQWLRSFPVVDRVDYAQLGIWTKPSVLSEAEAGTAALIKR